MIGARKRVFIPGYGGFVHRSKDTFGGTYAACARDSHYLGFNGNHPAMEKPSLVNPDEYYARSSSHTCDLLAHNAGCGTAMQEGEPAQKD